MNLRVKKIFVLHSKSPFFFGSFLACEQDKRATFNIIESDLSLVSRLEARMDQMSLELPQLKNFILPGEIHVLLIFMWCDLKREVLKDMCAKLEKKLLFMTMT